MVDRHMDTITLKAHAKINLGLRVLGKRDDGYHEIITIMQRVSLCDSITLEKAESEVVYTGPSLTVNPGDNLCVKAAEGFRKQFGNELGVRINLEKRIPTGSGLGGGSSDAGAVLRGMAALYGIGDDGKPRLEEIGALIGSDVLFFTRNLSAALCRGRGEIISNSQGLTGNWYILLLMPNFSISTGKAYRTLDDCLTFNSGRVKLSVRDFSEYQGGIPTAGMGNDFEHPVFTAHPELEYARDRMIELGAIHAAMTGSGSAIYGVFDGEAAVRAARSGWCQSWLSFVCRPY